MSRRLVLTLLGTAAIVASCAVEPRASSVSETALPSPSAIEQPTQSPREMVLCPSRVLGSCRGPLTPGTYRANEFETPFSYTVPEGWANYEDLPGNFLLLPPGEELAGVNNDTSEFIGLYDGVAPASANCDEVREPGIGVTPEAMATWYASHPGLSTSEAQSVSIGGLEGLVIDLDLADDHAATCPYAHAGEPLVPLLIGNGPAGLHHLLNASFTTRLYLLTAPGGETIAIEVVDHDGRMTLEELSAVVEMIEFGL